MVSSDELRKLTTLIFDVDGTLTDGMVSLESDGAGKRFHIRDLHWLKLALRAGLRVGVIAGRDDAENHRLVRELGLSFCRFGAKDKVAALEDLMAAEGLTSEEILYAGDDVIDLPVLRRVGVGVAVADAVPELDEAAKWRTCAAGGNGAVCEIIRRVLKEKNLLDPIMERYRR